MTLPFARTYNEAILFIRLRPCGCGETEARWQDLPAAVGGQPVRYFTGNCENCQRPRGFTIAMPEDAKQTPDAVFGTGDEPSHVIDPGEWLGIADLYGERATEVLSGGDLDTDELNVVYYALSARVAALDEILRFLGDADSVPEWMFRSIPGRAVYEASPERFSRGYLFGQQAALRANLQTFLADLAAGDVPGHVAENADDR